MQPLLENLVTYLEQSAEKFPQKEALLYRSERISYSQLLQQVRALTNHFIAAGIKRGDVVTVFSQNSPEMLLTLFALSYLGAIASPINFYVKAEELAYMLKDSGSKRIITQKEFLPVIQDAFKITQNILPVWCCGISQETEIAQCFPALEKTATIAPPVGKIKDTVLLLYTSGTTGESKGVMLTQENIVRNALASNAVLQISAEENFLCLLPLFHVFSLVATGLLPLLLGARVRIVESIRPPKVWLDFLRMDKITVVAAVPQIYALLSAHAKGIKGLVLRWLYFRRIKFLISGAAPLAPKTLLEFRKKLGKTILEGYGLTETSPVISVSTATQVKAGSVGRPIPGVEVVILDESGKKLETGTEGEICVKGHNLMQGYFHRPEETQATMTKDGYFKTGDIGFIDTDGFIFIRDRIKDMIIIKGLKVFSVQVEAVLNEHPDVAESAIVGIPDTEGNETIKAFVVKKENSSLSAAQLITWCAKKLPAYKRPRTVEFLEALPKNNMQKILKRTLRQRG